MNIKVLRKLSLLVFLMSLAFATTAFPQGTAFTYQGRLYENGNPANGIYDMNFGVWSSLAGPAPVGSAQNVAAIAVSNGAFTVTLDFGAGIFTGANRWLEIAVRTNGVGAGYTTLSPRQELKPTPYAIFSASAADVASNVVVRSINNLKESITLTAGANMTITPSGNTLTLASSGGNGPWLLSSSSNAYFNAGSVGIGTATPSAKLHIRSGDILAGAAGLEWIFHTRSSFNSDFLQITDSTGGTPQFQHGLVLTKSGSVGIGTTAPGGVLDVRSGNSSYVLVDSINGDLKFNGGADGAFGFYNDAAASGRTEIIGLGVPRLVVVNSGNVGVGTTAPAAKLDVRGSILLGANGQHFATGGEEDLRILRGEVTGSGGAPQGCCFSVNRVSAGVYDITLVTAFSGKPTITATAKSLGITVAVIDLASVNNSFRVATYYNGSGADSAFNFIAVGPR